MSKSIPETVTLNNGENTEIKVEPNALRSNTQSNAG